MSKTTHTVTTLSGDGIGPEVMTATKAVLSATGVSIVWEEAALGVGAIAEFGTPLPEDTLLSIAKNKVAIKGPTGTPIGGGHKSVNVELRKRFALYNNMRPVLLFPGVVSPLTSINQTGFDVIVFRENLEDLYVGEEHVSLDGQSAIAISRFSLAGSERFARRVFQYARAHGRKKVTIGHKANILKLTHGKFFLDVALRVAAEYPEIATDDIIADNLLQQLLRNPTRFDCLLLPNFIGDLVSDDVAALVGGLGFAPGANIGDDCAIFEAVHGTAPDIVGQGIANPIALVLSGAMMLEYLGETDASRRVNQAVRKVLAEGKYLTKDMSPSNFVSTSTFTDELIRNL